MKEKKIFNIPNILTLYRIAVFPLILGFILCGKENLFAIFVIINLLTDIADGFIARKFHLETEFGAKIDSFADDLTYLLAIIGMLISSYKLVRTFLGYSYKKIPPAKQLRQHLEDLKTWHNTNGSGDNEAIVDFDQYFDERLSEAAEHNSANNIERGNYLHDATLFVVIAFIFLFCASPFYIYERVTSKDKVYQVNLIDKTLKKEEKEMAENKSGSSNKGQQVTPSAAPLQTPSAAPKPSGPQNVVFKGNTDGGKTRASDSGLAGEK